MKTAKDLAIIGVYCALLLGSQFALSGIAGVEVITVLLACFCYFFNIKKSLILVNVFILLRCLIFGLYPTVIILYFVYYNLFCVIVCFIGKKFNHEYSVKKHVIVVITVALLTCLFTLLDDAITPLFYHLDFESAKGYFIMSLYTMATQVICAMATVILLFPPIIKGLGFAYKKINKS